MAGLIAVLAGPAAYAATPLSHPIAGTNPVAGPTAGGAFGGLGISADALRDFAGFGGGASTGFAGRGAFGGEPGSGDRHRAGEPGRRAAMAGTLAWVRPSTARIWSAADSASQPARS